jgi:nitroreductase
MQTNTVIETLLKHRSIRHYRDEPLTDEIIKTIVRAGQQAPFASQLYSVLLKRGGKLPFGAPALFTICVDAHKLERFMEKRGWNVVTNDVSLLLFGIQDAALMAENMVIAAESLELGTCFLGSAPYRAEQIAAAYDLPPRVFPLVQLTVGYPDASPPPRPRYPLGFTLFEDSYGEIDEATLEAAMTEMDEGYLDQEYYRRANYMIPLQGDREETYSFETYSWTEHISRKWGQWYPSPAGILEQLEKCGFRLTGDEEEKTD